MNGGYRNKMNNVSDAESIPGWNASFESVFSAYNGPYIPCRITAQHKTVCNIMTVKGEVQAAISGAMCKVGKQLLVRDFVVLLQLLRTVISKIARIRMNHIVL